MTSDIFHFHDHHAVEGSSNAVINEAAFSSSFQDKRKSQRHITILRVALIRFEGHSELCLIRNISTGGLMAHVYSRIEVGQHLTVEFRDGTCVSGEVRWGRGEAIGMAFDQEIDVAAVLAASPFTRDGKQSRAPRIEMSCTVGVRRQDHSLLMAQLQDISQGGVKILAIEELFADEHVVIDIPEFGAIAGTVRWKKGCQAGISFVQPISYPKLSQWLKLKLTF